MTLRIVRTESEATIDGVDMSIAEGSTTLDLSAVPYASARLDLPFLSESDLAALDPRDGVRVPYTLGDGADTRAFDLGLRSISVDHEAKRVSLEVASDEALLIDYKTLVTDAGARAHEASLRDVVDYVLAKIGASLEAGSEDADVTAYWQITNLITNPSIEVDTAGWIAGQGAGSLSRQALIVPPAVSGSYGIRWVSTVGGISNIVPAPTVTTYGITPGRWYVFSAYLYASAVRNARAAIQWFASDGAVPLAESYGSIVATSTSAFNRIFVIAQAPPGASHANPFINTAGTTAGDAFIADGAMLYEGDEVVPYFDGGTTDTAAYGYAWQGTASASPSTRTPTTERPPALFVWKPGVSAWEFLAAITATSNLVLWCDESRDWWLASPENRTIVELVAVTEGNTRTGVDTINLNDGDTTPTGVAVTFLWDEDGMTREEYDVAGTPERVYSITLARAYPGPGIAAAMLTRRQGTGRRQDVNTITQLATTPGMTAQISLPGAPDTVGRVESVVFDHRTGFMDLGTAGLVDIIPGTVDALVGTVDSLAGTVDSL